jgi:hypothetical protein
LSKVFKITLAPTFEVTMFPSEHTGLVIPKKGYVMESQGQYILDSRFHSHSYPRALPLAAKANQ